MKISAIDFSLAGDKYLGRSYQEMDCQAFVETVSYTHLTLPTIYSV